MKLFNAIAAAAVLGASFVSTTPAEAKGNKSLVDLVRETTGYVEDHVIRDSKALIPLPYIQVRRRGRFVSTNCVTDSFHTPLYGSHYCGADEQIVLEKEQLEAFRKSFGDGAVRYIVFHEYAHHLQKLKGTSLKQPNHELQADCYAGGLMFNSAYTRNKLGLNEHDFVEVVNAAHAAGGSHSHGSHEARVDAVKHGAKNGINSCDEMMGTSTAYNSQLPIDMFRFDDTYAVKVTGPTAGDTYHLWLYPIQGESTRLSSTIAFTCGTKRFTQSWRDKASLKHGYVSSQPAINNIARVACK